MVGWDGLVRLIRWLWHLFGTFLNLRDARQIVASFSVGLVGDIAVQIIDAVRALPDFAYYGLVILVPFVIAFAVARTIFRSKPFVPPPAPAGPTATATDHSSAASGGRDAASSNAGNGGTALSGVFHGPVTVINQQSFNPKEGDPTPPKNLPPDADATEQRMLWLAGLASWRNVGVARRNSLLALTGEKPEERANVIYTAWLIKVVEWIRQLPVNGRTEAHAFETLDRFPMDNAPDGNYANDTVRWISAMFSTHLERLEELRKRYTRTD